MNTIQKKLTWCGFVAYMSAPSFVSATPWDFGDEPLWLSTAVQHNVMFALDDSGSMDFEVLFTNNDGAVYLNGNGYFADSSGNLYSSGDKYVYLFPNGQNGSYEGRRINNNHHAIPPVPAYAFARSADYNRSYYNPEVEYLPWPDYPEYSSTAGKDTFTDAPLTLTPFEAVSSLNFDDGGSEGGLALFADHDTAGNTTDKWAFDIEDGDMVCDADGNTCSTGQKDYTYYPATYYLKDETSTIYYHPPEDITSANSSLLEAEDGTFSDPFRDADSLDAAVASNAGGYTSNIAATIDAERADIAEAKANAVGNDFIGTPTYETGNNLTSIVLSSGEGSSSYSFKTQAGTVNIWMRVFTRSGSNDSFFVKLDGYNALSVGSTLTLGPDSDNIWPVDGGLEWNQFWQQLTTADGEWQWKLWATVDVATATQTLEIRRREGGTYLDQILVTEDLTFTPTSGIEVLPTPGTSVALNCATDMTSALYQEFVSNPERFLTGSSAASDRIDGLAYDGSCLKKYEVGKTGADNDTFDNGVAVTRTVLEEKQNFANWFMYYRKRHQAMRGGLASAVQGINGIKTGLFWINNRRTVGANDMFDMDTNAGVKGFIEDHFETVRSGGTPLRPALEHARSQFAASTGPVTSECQKNYTLLFTDGFSTTTVPSGIGNEDELAPEPYADEYSGTLADIAYKGYTELLRPSTDFETGNVSIPSTCGTPDATNWLDCNANLHMNTYTVGLGANGTIFGVTHNTIEDAYNNPPTWPDVTGTRDARQIDDLYHAAVNGRGGMYNAASPDQLSTALGSALDDIVATIGSGASVTFNTSSLEDNDGTAVYAALFNSADWTGDLAGVSLDSETAALVELIWEDSNGDGASAATLLAERDLSTDPRVILTLGDDGSGNAEGVAFQWDNLLASQKLDLKTNPDGTTRDATYPFTSSDPEYDGAIATNYDADADGKARLAFIRGEITANMVLDTFVSGAQKSYALRNRINDDTGLPKRMADVIHSAPVYVGRPSSGWPDADPFGGTAVDGSERYSFFKDKTISEGGVRDRDPVVYIGANGGMLHGFNASASDADGGKEVLAYIPGSVYSSSAGEGLHYLTDPAYSHKYYVDLSPVVEDVYTTQNGTGAAEWRTMLVGGLRGGGRGIFALDVSNPDSFAETSTAAADTVMWEFTNSDDADMGYLLNPPTIAMMNNDKWAVVFGNGLDSDSGVAKVFVLFVEEGLDGTWSTGDYVELDTEIGSSSDKNGITGVTLADTDGDAVVDRIYAGDLYGNIWTFDVTSSNAGQWDSAYKAGNTPEPLFTATDASSNRQPITSAPDIILNVEQVTGGNEPNILVTFGTGQYLTSGDESDTSVQTYYTVWDKGTGDLDRSQLEVRELETVTNADGDEGRTIKDTAVDIDWTSKYGWYMDFKTATVQEGERLISQPLVVVDAIEGPVALFSTIIPSSSECAGGGESILYLVPLLTGTNPTKALIDLDGDGTFDNDLVGFRQTGLRNRAALLGNRLFSTKGLGEDIVDTDDALAAIQGLVDKDDTDLDTSSSRTGRLGWNELVSD